MLEVLGGLWVVLPPLDFQTHRWSNARWRAEGILDDLPVERKRPFGSFQIYGFGDFDFEIPQKASQLEPSESQCGGGP
jgi:hypothetical protein